MIHFALGAMTLLTGLALVVIGTDYGRMINVTLGVIIVAILILLGMARLKFAWLNRTH